MSALLRIAHVISTKTGFGGAEQTLAQLVRFGAAQGWTQRVLNPFALDPESDATREFYAPAAYEGASCSSWSSIPALRRWLTRRLDEFRPDIVHAHLYHAEVLVASIPRPRGARLVLSHQHGDHFVRIGSRRGAAIDRLAGRRFDRVVGCSQYVERWLTARYRYPAARVTSVRNGWSGQPLAPAANGGPPTVVCVARLRRQKDHRTLIDAIDLVSAELPDVRLWLVGEGEERPALEAQVKDLSLTERVRFVGTADDVWPLLANAHVFALASSYEPLGIAALEAMAAGLPVVATAVGGLPEIVLEGETGFLVAPGDASAMAVRIKALLGDPDMRAAMTARAQAVAAEHHAEKMGEGYARVYAELHAGRR